MGSNTFGRLFSFTTFGESHGASLGCVIDGFPPLFKIDIDKIQDDLNRRRPGSTSLGTKRDEKDKVRILSGIFEGLTTGQSICMIIDNEDQKSSDYSNIKNIFRPGHADFSLLNRYQIRDYRGGGRSSARETVSRVMAGSLAKQYLEKENIKIEAGVIGVGKVLSSSYSWDYPFPPPLYAPESKERDLMIKEIEKARENKDSVGSLIECRIKGLEAGVGDVVFDKLDALLAKAMFSLGAVKGFEIGEGFNSTRLFGSENNDQMDRNGYLSNHAGGILGGMSNGNEIVFRVAFKPTPSISKVQKTIDENGREIEIEIKGRHDPCVGPRAVVVVEAMASAVILDSLLIKRAYQNL